MREQNKKRVLLSQSLKPGKGDGTHMRQINYVTGIMVRVRMEKHRVL